MANRHAWSWGCKNNSFVIAIAGIYFNGDCLEYLESARLRFSSVDWALLVFTETVLLVTSKTHQAETQKQLVEFSYGTDRRKELLSRVGCLFNALGRINRRLNQAMPPGLCCPLLTGKEIDHQLSQLYPLALTGSMLLVHGQLRVISCHAMKVSRMLEHSRYVRVLLLRGLATSCFYLPGDVLTLIIHFAFYE